LRRAGRHFAAGLGGFRRVAAPGHVCLFGIALACASSASAQSLSRVSLDSVASVDLFRGNGTTGNPDMSLDVSSVIRISDAWSVQLRPWFFRSSAQGAEWSKEMYGAAVRYERPASTSVRVDAGYIPLPIGLGMLDMRADANPTIQAHPSYFVPLLPFERGGPQLTAIASSYPLGALATVSGRRWDARAAVINSAPTRRYALNAEYGNPASTPVAVAGGGVSPIPGMRVGGSFAAGAYATAQEVADGNERNLRMWTGGAEYAFAYTRVAAEVTSERFDGPGATNRSSSWFAQGVQTLSPRWFAAGRYETIAGPPPVFMPPGSPRVSFVSGEGTVGFRVTRDVTLRTSIAGTRYYTATSADRRVGVQIVWARRWW
jgi:hypothetical protein